VPEELQTRIAAAAAGNPLFIGEMLAMTQEVGGDIEVPPSLKALLAARLDQLDDSERRVLERGAVEGELFHRGAVQALTPEEPQVTPRLAALVRRALIRPDATQFAGQDGFRFRHLLIRDAAYEALPKSTRADLHQRLATWLEQHGTELVELDEVLGYHLEQACRYRAELGLPADDELAAAAKRRLAAGGHRAALRQDYGAAISLFERAAALVSAAPFDLALESELGDALMWMDRSDDALRRADDLAERASAAGDRVGELCGRIQGGVFQLSLEPEGAGEKLAALVEQALPVFHAAGDELALYIAYSALAQAAETRAQWDAALEAYEQAFAYARQADHVPAGFLAWRAACRFFGTSPLSELLAWLDANEPHAGRDHFLRAYRAGSLAMQGRFNEARAILAKQRAELAARGGGVLLANITAFESVWVELWAGDPATAAEFGAEGCRLHEELGEQSLLPNAASNLAQALYALDRLDEAAGWARRAADLGASNDAWNELLWRQVLAKVLARRGQHADAQRLAHEAVALCEKTDMLNAQGDAYADLAEVLLLSGNAVAATATLEQALERYNRKENRVSAQRAQERLASLQNAAHDPVSRPSE
jgi:tetratricopeptide (TPR) repeat protein